MCARLFNSGELQVQRYLSKSYNASDAMIEEGMGAVLRVCVRLDWRQQQSQFMIH